jgi:uncharacterized protein YndB with AHSA1/START domain
MPIKKDGRGKRWVEMELVVPGTPEELWAALATGPGNAAWFLGGEIEPRVGGAFRLDFGEGVVTSGEVTHWEPPHQFGYVERDWEKDAPPLATEITVAGRSGRQCVVRMLHSLFASSDDWDDQIEGFEKGWPGFFAVLRLYLTHFAGAKAASFVASAPTRLDALSAWLRLGDALGLVGANVGERRAASPGPESWSALVEHVHQEAQQRYALVLLEGPAPGCVLTGIDDKGSGVRVSLARYYYGENAGALASEQAPRWREWLGKTFG